MVELDEQGLTLRGSRAWNSKSISAVVAAVSLNPD
jgi:hypothetical protein